MKNAVSLIVLTATVTSGCGGGGSSSSNNAFEAIPDEAILNSDTEEAVQPAGSLTLQWNEPRFRVDGSCVIDLLGYRVNFGLVPGNYGEVILVPTLDLDCEESATADRCGIQRTCSYRVPDLSSASWYVTVQAYDTYGNISAHSNEIVRTIE